MEDIKTKMDRFYGIIKDYEEGGTGTRYKSWEWCHQAFLKGMKKYRMKFRKKTKNKIVEHLSLHLAFYLASWGMYRGSSFLLQRDYKAHKTAVKNILDKKYKLLWDYEPTKENVEVANKLLFDSEDGIYWKIKDSYKYNDVPSETLTTKILMGTFGCIPAFDRFLKSGINRYNEAMKLGNGNKLTQFLEKQKGREVTDSFKELAYFAINNRKDLRIEAEFNYPAMKCVDMFFWEIGYEVDLAYELRKTSKSTKGDKLLVNAISLGLCDKGLSYKSAATQILAKN